jgi:hypothetical protein
LSSKKQLCSGKRKGITSKSNHYISEIRNISYDLLNRTGSVTNHIDGVGVATKG